MDTGTAPRSWLERLAEDPSFAQLTRSVAMSLGSFWFFLLVGDAMQLEPTLHLLETQVSLLLADLDREAMLAGRKTRWGFGRDIRLQILGQGQDPQVPLQEEVVSPLIGIRPPPDRSSIIAILATPRSPAEEAEWTAVFHSLNLARDVIAGCTQRPLMLALPVALERVFAAAAPDLWSTRARVLKLPGFEPEATG